MPASKKKSADAGDAELPPSVLVELERRVNQVEALETSYILTSDAAILIQSTLPSPACIQLRCLVLS
jgi:hypothetical protein